MIHRPQQWDDNIPFPVDSSYDEATVRRRFLSFSIDPPEEPCSRFKMFVPLKSRRIESLQSIGDNWKLQACFMGNSEYPVEVTVMTRRLSHEVNPADLLDVTIDAADHLELLHRRYAVSICGRISDVLVREGSRIRRVMVSKNGPTAIQVMGECNENDYALFAEDIHFMLQSFHPLVSAPTPFVEPVEQHKVQGRFPFRFFCPASYAASAVDRDWCNDGIELAAGSGEPRAGLITVGAALKDEGGAPVKVATRYLELLKLRGLRMGGTEFLTIERKPKTINTMLCMPQALRNGQPLDCPVFVFEYLDAYVLLALLGPSREVSPEWWAINKRAFEIVRDSLRIGGMPQQG